MKKARLIKQGKTAEAERQKPDQQSVVKKTLNDVTEWVESRKARRKDPRKAFAALFSQAQTE